ncbi:HD-like signal output (HDOD) protein [Sulfuritortus calidifontis]|uniref:HD-like signal output (HDOD) protein n=1 Tax=Sulfuritortus calidifontis TaxID=1914471 RepID=A0A4R3K0Q1_9PROT|nr:HDOD domain-containing protein [Sulfuritortus calidifontis]TCS73415.1 HD-like signal output (HDOD) protein [Sulfuritortus calidifontis]
MSQPAQNDPVLPEQLNNQLEATLKEIGIPPRPAILEEISREMRSEEPDFNRVALLISRDVSLAASFLKTANSPFYGYRHKARSVRDALIMLGLKVAARTVAGVILKHALPTGPNLERFWDASDRTAQLSGWLVQRLGAQPDVQSDDAYTYGLFRDCGIPIMMRKFPNYPAILAEANQDGERPFTEVEEAYLPTNHALVGCLLAQSWWLPEPTCLAIRHQHDYILMRAGLQSLPAASRRLIALAQLAEWLQQRLTGLNTTQEWQKMGAACLAQLELTEDALPALLEAAREFLEETYSEEE